MSPRVKQGYEDHADTRKRSGGWTAVHLLRLNPENDRREFGDFPLEWAVKICDPDYTPSEEDKQEIIRMLDEANPNDPLYNKTMKWMVDSVMRFGVQEPLRGYWDKDTQTFVVTAGNRRTVASNIVVKVFGSDLKEVRTDLEKKEGKSDNPLDLKFRQWIENHGRLDYSRMEEALTIRGMLDLGARLEDLPAVLGVGSEWLSETLNLPTLLPEAQELVKNGEVAPTTAIDIIKEARLESSNPVAASKKATRRVVTLAETAKASGQRATHTLAKELKRQEVQAQAQANPDLQAELIDRRSTAMEKIGTALEAGLKNDGILSRQVKLLLEGTSPDTLKQVIKLLSIDSSVALDALEKASKNLERQVG
jgi:hypothetical protein